MCRKKIKQGIFVDLKKADKDKDLPSFIQEKSVTADNINKISIEKRIRKSSFFKTDSFTLKNSEEMIVCLDALDEVSQQDFSRVVDRIKEFSKQYKNIHLFISCREHHFKKYQELFIDTDFSYIQIASFSRSQTHDYLEKHGLSKDDIEKITDIFEFKDRELLIQTPRYLEMITDIINEKGMQHLIRLTKTDIFEHFIYKKLEIEEKRINGQKKEIIKRVLEKLALIMEIYQRNFITKEELMTFFDDVKSNLNISFLQQVPIEMFYERSLLKDNKDTIEFENTEFQEYLAAKEILRLGRIDQVVFDLVVDQELQEISYSWFNTLGFVIDLDISILKPVLFFGSSKKGVVQDEEYHRLLTETDTNRLSIEDRKDIFKKVFMYYQTALHWIGLEITKNLSCYFDISQSDLLKESIDERKNKGTARLVKRGNVAYVLAFLFERGVFSESQRDHWKDRLIEFTNEKKGNGVLQRGALFALSKLKNIELIKKVSGLFNKYDDLIDQEFLIACSEVDPNDQFSIQCFVEGAKKDNITASYGLCEIKEKDAVKYLLDCFINDSKFLAQFMSPQSIYQDNKIIQNIRNAWDLEIQKKLEDIMKVALSDEDLYFSEKSEFIKNIALLLKENNADYIFILLSEIKNSHKLEDNLFGIKEIFTLILEKRQVDNFIQELKEFDVGERIALSTLQLIKVYKRRDCEEIYEEGRGYFKKEYEEYEEYWKAEGKKPSAEAGIYREFQSKLEPGKGMYVQGVFRFYLENKEKLASFITEHEKELLRTLIIESIFEKFDPGEQKLVITKKEDGKTSYTTNGWIHIFDDCLRIAKELKIDIFKYRQKIISHTRLIYGKLWLLTSII